MPDRTKLSAMMPRLFKVLFWSALIFALVMANLPQTPMVGEVNDKSLHLLAFALLAALIGPAYPARPLWLLYCLLAIFGAMIEFTQMFDGQGRQASFEDWVADLIAAGGVLLAIGLMRAAVSTGSSAGSKRPNSDLE